MGPKEKAEIRAARALQKATAMDRCASRKAPGNKPRVTLPPLPPRPKQATPIDPEDFTPEKIPFESAANKKPQYIKIEDFVLLTQRELLKPKNLISTDVFRTLCATAIGMGGTSLQDMTEKFGKNIIPKNVDVSLKPWPLPAPETVRQILEFFSTLTPDQFTGSKRPWRHARYVPAVATPEPRG